MLALRGCVGGWCPKCGFWVCRGALQEVFVGLICRGSSYIVFLLLIWLRLANPSAGKRSPFVCEGRG